MSEGLVKIEVLNLKELNRALRRLEGKELQGQLKEAHRRASITAARYVQREAPVRTGRLALSTRARPQATAGVVSIGMPRSVPYAGPTIWGWPAHNVEPNKYPFHGITKGEQDIIRQYEQEVNDIIRKAGLL